MLKFFSRLERTRNFVLLAFAILMVASLVFFYAPSSRNVSANLTRSEETAAKVGGERITLGEVALQQENSRQGGRTTPSKYIIDRLVGDRLMRVEAARLGLATTDAEVASFIRKQFKSPDGAAFDRQRYEQNVTEQTGSVKKYEDSVRDFLSSQKLQAFVTSGVTVSEQQILEDYQRKNTKFDLTYVPVTTTDLAQNIKPSDEELKTYFDQHKKDYYVSVPQKKIRYIFINAAKLGEKIPLTDTELQAEYNNIPADKKTLGVE
ncbi:MAG: SurA N-terminal domain-containing protein, partial [Acidobacteriota bacterium]|nr:SurA N-terminal domain-containing protein [Acidobacteriota bacterium]